MNGRTRRRDTTREWKTKIEEITMPDDPKIKGPQDRKRINIQERYEVNYWSKKLGVSPDSLRDAVKAVGTSVDKVREYIEKRKSKAA